MICEDRNIPVIPVRDFSATLVERFIETEAIGTQEEYQVANRTESVFVDGNGVLHLTITNLSVSENYEVDDRILDREIKEVKGEIVTEEMHAKNTFGEAGKVYIKEFSGVWVTEKGLEFTVPACSMLHGAVK